MTPENQEKQVEQEWSANSSLNGINTQNSDEQIINLKSYSKKQNVLPYGKIPAGVRLSLGLAP